VSSYSFALCLSYESFSISVYSPLLPTVAWPSFYTQGDTTVAGLHVWQMSHSFGRWPRPGAVFHSAWRAASMGLDQPVLSVSTATAAVMMPSASPPQWTSTARPPCALLGVTGRSLRDSLATRPEVLSFGTSLEPFFVCHFLPARGDAFACKVPSLQGGETFSSSFLARRRALPGARQCLADCLSRAELAGCSPRASFLDSFQEMVKGKGVPP
jgi:hypothetical protein